MANTAKYIQGGPTHADTLYVGGTTDTVKLQGTLKYTVGTVAAAGNSQATATAISDQVTYVTAADGTKAVVLPAAVAGLTYKVYNTTTSTLPVYPASGDDINDGTADAAITMQPKSCATFQALDTSTWACVHNTDWTLVDITLADGVDIAVNGTTGTKIGTAVSQKLAFWNAVPVVQPVGAAQAAVGAMTLVGTNTGTSDVGLSLIGATNTGDRSAAIMNDFKALMEDVTALATLANALRTALVNTGLIKGAA